MTEKLNLIETLAKDPKFSTLSNILVTSGAASSFANNREFTVFAPSNDAFKKLPEATINELLNEPEQVKLKALLSYHILPVRVMAVNLASTSIRKSVTGEELSFTDTNGLKVNDSGIQARNIEASNGVIHQIDTVLTPPPVAAAAYATGSTGIPSAPASTPRL